MLLVALRRFHEYEVRMFEGHRISMERRAARPDVTREDDDLLAAALVDDDLETGGPEDVAGLHRADADAGGNRGRVVVPHAP